MKVSYFQVENDSILPVHQEILPHDWKEKLKWVDIRFESRKEVIDYFNDNSFFKEGLDCIEHPENNPFAKTFDITAILNLDISNKENIYKSDYVSIIIEEELVITIIPESSNLLTNSNLFPFTKSKFSKFPHFLFYNLAANILSQSNINMGIARDSIHQLEDKITHEPNAISPSELMSFERNIRKLSDIIEDQYVGFGILSSLTTNNLSNGENEPTKELIKGFDPLNKTMARLEKQAESFRLQYMLIQQQESTRKINALTIIQAVFVPLTFIAGVYGMNFVNIPELNFENGYYVIWGVFVLLAGALLNYFYRHGWFD